jgi:hypothetical protein
MNASRTRRSATIYFELPDLRRYRIAVFEPRSGMSPRRLGWADADRAAQAAGHRWIKSTLGIFLPFGDVANVCSERAVMRPAPKSSLIAGYEIGHIA